VTASLDHCCSAERCTHLEDRKRSPARRHTGQRSSVQEQ
jgi:hypothetical protein